MLFKYRDKPRCTLASAAIKVKEWQNKGEEDGLRSGYQ
jgi:hypothetical protein